MNQSPKNTQNNPIFLDANVLIEVILARRQAPAARAFLAENSSNLHISALSAHLIVHFGKSIVELPVLRKFLADYTILPLMDADFDWAFNNIRGDDYEDALQLAVAIRSGCYKFITLDKNLAKIYQDLPSISVKLLN